MRSFPPIPNIRSLPLPPLMTSSPAVPLMVAALPSPPAAMVTTLPSAMMYPASRCDGFDRHAGQAEAQSKNRRARRAVAGVGSRDVPFASQGRAPSAGADPRAQVEASMSPRERAERPRGTHPAASGPGSGWNFAPPVGRSGRQRGLVERCRPAGIAAPPRHAGTVGCRATRSGWACGPPGRPGSCRGSGRRPGCRSPSGGRRR